MTDSNRPREEIQKFAALMEVKLKDNDNKEHWTYFSYGYLLDKLKKQVEFLERDLINRENLPTRERAANVANYAMMISDKVDKM